MWQRLVVDHDLVVTKETVRHTLRFLDPERVHERFRHRLQRHQYKGRGPNFLWHINGFDKLKPYGFCIHGGIDGYSRRILWLEVSISNNEPAFIAKYFVDCVKAAGGTARIVRADLGTENTYIFASISYALNQTLKCRVVCHMRLFSGATWSMVCSLEKILCSIHLKIKWAMGKCVFSRKWLSDAKCSWVN